MPADCPHDHCHYFLWDGNASCPACGRHPRASIDRRQLGILAGSALITVVVLAQLRGLWLLAALAVVAVTVTRLAAFAIDLRRAALPATTTLDARYGDASGRASTWLSNWIELHRLSSGRDELAADERLLLVEAQSTAADAATDAVQRRNAIGHEYLTNAFDRLGYLSELDRRQSTTAGQDESRPAWDRAVHTVDHYLETLWLDPAAAAHARTTLAGLDSTARRSRIARAAEAITFTADPAPIWYDQDDDIIDIQRRRLRTERALFLD